MALTLLETSLEIPEAGKTGKDDFLRLKNYEHYRMDIVRSGYRDDRQTAATPEPHWGICPDNFVRDYWRIARWFAASLAGLVGGAGRRTVGDRRVAHFAAALRYHRSRP